MTKCKKGNYNCHHKLITHYNALIATLGIPIIILNKINQFLIIFIIFNTNQIRIDLILNEFL